MDYRFAIRCWQDQAGDENAKANVFVDGVQVATEVEITATSEASAQLITWESTGLADPAPGNSFDIKVVLANEYYVDSSNDRNIIINGIGYLTKDSDGNYRNSYQADADPLYNPVVTDFTTLTKYRWEDINPSAVTGDQIESDWWSNLGGGAFYHIYVWGGSNGTTMTTPITEHSYT